ncbi:enoyl-CoA hydratase [Siminovitchia acidinfaciens]|uniref:Enoyl-CoA hydratase n=1 Tax=Siminovitchia acidinfaciens TaxID=2321395 RepID=A0A429Y4N0_9BACI|nr:enoyl-CoA hydratase [Siminovitchia acidinfaciens]RST76299.1 enoyl-CoA hydratase [Siminovitchia acidinfaciens]
MGVLSVTKEGNAALIKMERPPANALSTEVIKELEQLFDELSNDKDVRAILLYGEGRFFSAGADIKEFTEVQSGEEFSELASNGQRVFEKIESFSKPVVAAIHGAALGGGLELAMACHIRLVSENAKLGLPELQLGLIPGFAGTQRLPRYVGVAKAAEMLFTSKPITGKEAVQWGLANQYYSEEELLDKAKEMVFDIAKKSPASLKAVIELLQFGKDSRFYEGEKLEAEKFGEVFTTKDGQEGISAFIEKREPNFIGE